MTENLEHRFHRAMIEVYERARDEAGYVATRFLHMVSEKGGLATAKQLLHAPGVSEGFTALWERQRLDLTMERLILRPDFAELFTEEDRAIAESRLQAYGYRST